MHTYIAKVDSLNRSIQVVLSKNRHVFLVEDIKLLENCVEELDKLKQELLMEDDVSGQAFNRLLRIINLLDAFFGLSGTILDFFEKLD